MGIASSSLSTHLTPTTPQKHHIFPFAWCALRRVEGVSSSSWKTHHFLEGKLPEMLHLPPTKFGARCVRLWRLTSCWTGILAACCLLLDCWLPNISSEIVLNKASPRMLSPGCWLLAACYLLLDCCLLAAAGCWLLLPLAACRLKLL